MLYVLLIAAILVALSCATRDWRRLGFIVGFVVPFILLFTMPSDAFRLLGFSGDFPEEFLYLFWAGVVGLLLGVLGYILAAQIHPRAKTPPFDQGSRSS